MLRKWPLDALYVVWTELSSPMLILLRPKWKCLKCETGFSDR